MGLFYGGDTDVEEGLYLACHKTSLGWDELNPDDPEEDGFEGDTHCESGYKWMLWLVSEMLWGMTGVRLYGYGVVGEVENTMGLRMDSYFRWRKFEGFPLGGLCWGFLWPWFPSISQTGCFRRQENSYTDRLNVVKESCIATTGGVGYGWSSAELLIPLSWTPSRPVGKQPKLLGI
ncbi:hypothetical protein TIFTF001_020511 [Ficus carica]|uniref:Uncharacterized protein n=1 Tax=Ficus carica TaxID=3494 RepID=A0AA88AG74_FICCA|nr:hypothetical protein TIFTF001_020511 [Ficus carica]